MKKIIITGALGQIGTELVIKCRERYGTENVLATDIRKPEPHSPVKDGPFEILDVTDRNRLFETVRYFNADTLIHMAALLSATAEKKPLVAWDLNMGGYKYTRSSKKVSIKIFYAKFNRSFWYIDT